MKRSMLTGSETAYADGEPVNTRRRGSAFISVESIAFDLVSFSCSTVPIGLCEESPLSPKEFSRPPAG